jgi:hypothetical protein
MVTSSGISSNLPQSFAAYGAAHNAYGAVAQHNAYGAVPPHMVTSSGISSNLPQSFAAYGALSQNDLESIPE